MGFDELEFILAEAALKGIINGGDAAARTYYEAAVTANMQKWTKFAQAAVPNNTPVDYIITDDIRLAKETEQDLLARTPYEVFEDRLGNFWDFMFF